MERAQHLPRLLSLAVYGDCVQLYPFQKQLQTAHPRLSPILFLCRLPVTGVPRNLFFSDHFSDHFFSQKSLLFSDHLSLPRRGSSQWPPPGSVSWREVRRARQAEGCVCACAGSAPEKVTLEPAPLQRHFLPMVGLNVSFHVKLTALRQKGITFLITKPGSDQTTPDPSRSGPSPGLPVCSPPVAPPPRGSPCWSFMNNTSSRRFPHTCVYMHTLLSYFFLIMFS